MRQLVNRARFLLAIAASGLICGVLLGDTALRLYALLGL